MLRLIRHVSRNGFKPSTDKQLCCGVRTSAKKHPVKQAIKLAKKEEHMLGTLKIRPALMPSSPNATSLTMQLPLCDDAVELDFVGICGIKVVLVHHFNDVQKIVPILLLNRGCNMVQIVRVAQCEV
eukprot:1086367-Pelagomonas_calceolata.AAC.4